MGWPGGCWFFNERLTYSAPLSCPSFRFPFPVSLLHSPSSAPSNSLSGERIGWFEVSGAFSLGPFSSDIIPYPICNTHRAWKLFVSLLTKQVPHAIHGPSNADMVALNLYEPSSWRWQLKWGHLLSSTQFIPVDSETTNRTYQNNLFLIIQRF